MKRQKTNEHNRHRNLKNMLSERSQKHRTADYKIFIYVKYLEETHPQRQQVNGCLGLRVKWGMKANGHEVSSWGGDGDVLK